MRKEVKIALVVLGIILLVGIAFVYFDSVFFKYSYHG